MTSLNPSLRLALINKAKSRKNLLQKGFTLVELMIVIVIVGVLSGVALPNFINQQNKAKAACADTQVSALSKEQQVYWAEESAFAADYATLGTAAPDPCVGYSATTLNATTIQASPTDTTNGYCVTSTLASGSYTINKTKGGCA